MRSVNFEIPLELPYSTQAELLNLNQHGLYYEQVELSNEEITAFASDCALIDARNGNCRDIAWT